MACEGVRCAAPAGARVAAARPARALRAAASRTAPHRRGTVVRAAAGGGVKAAPVPVTATDDDDLYTYTPKGQRVKKPTNAFERALFDYYFKPPELSPWELKLKEFTEENFRGLRDWATIFTELKAKNIKTITPEQAAAAVASRRAPGPLDAVLGAPTVLLDVREERYFRSARPEGADNVPLYKPLLEPKNNFEWARFIAFGLLAVRAPVRNEQFIEEVTALVGGKKNTPIMVICSSGGTLETAAERKIRAPRIPAPIFGKYGAASRSLLAIHELVVLGGFTNVVHVDGGYSAYKARKLPGDWDE